MRILVLDDMDIRHQVIGDMLKRRGHEVVAVRTFAEVVEAMKGPRFDQMFLDHDLEDFKYEGIPLTEIVTDIPDFNKHKLEELTGTDVAEYIVAQPYEKIPKKVTIHSWNMSGAHRMHQILTRMHIDTEVAPFSDKWI